jgi:CheY-like chemotaxis protein
LRIEFKPTTAGQSRKDRDNGAMHAPHVLVVDDCPDKLATMKLAAQSAHPAALIQTAETVRAGMEAIHLFPGTFDVALLDFDLPDGTGAELAHTLRTKSARTRIALGTARAKEAGFEEARALTLEAGADEAFTSSREEFSQNIQAVVSQGPK